MYIVANNCRPTYDSRLFWFMLYFTWISNKWFLGELASVHMHLNEHWNKLLLWHVIRRHMAKKSIPFRNEILGNKYKISYRRVTSQVLWYKNILFPIDKHQISPSWQSGKASMFPEQDELVIINFAIILVVILIMAVCCFTIMNSDLFTFYLHFIILRKDISNSRSKTEGFDF